MQSLYSFERIYNGYKMNFQVCYQKVVFWTHSLALNCKLFIATFLFSDWYHSINSVCDFSFFYYYSANFPTLYREAFAALTDAMHRKFDKNAQSSNQLKTWDSSVKIVDTFLEIAKIANHPRIYFFYLKVQIHRSIKEIVL